MALIGFVFRTGETTKKIMLAHLAAKQLDSVMAREVVMLDCGYRADLLNDSYEALINIFFAVLEVFAV
jgi:hypothetical protein